MKRSMTMFILIAMFVALFASVNTTHAANVTTEVHNIFMTDYANPVSGDSYFTGAMLSTDGDSYTAVSIRALDDRTYEDYFPAYGAAMTISLDLDERGYTGTGTMYSAEYGTFVAVKYAQLDDSDIGTIDNVDSSGSITYGTVNGDQAQFTGFVVNGAMYLLREANAYSTHGTGYIVQNGNLISYAVSNGEDAPLHIIYIALTLH